VQTCSSSNPVTLPPPRGEAGAGAGHSPPTDHARSTPLTEKLSEYVDSGSLDAQYVAVGERSTAPLAVCIGASSTSARTFTATSANGLLYMAEQLHWTAGARLPMVMCVVNRAVGAPFNIWNDHQDSISQRDTGWIQIHAKDHQRNPRYGHQGLPALRRRSASR